MTTFSSVERDFHSLAPSSEFCSLRVVNNETERLSVQRNVVQPPQRSSDCGAMITIFDSGLGYAATADLSASGLAAGLREAQRWATATAGSGLIEAQMLHQPAVTGTYQTPASQPWNDQPVAMKIDLLRALCERLNRDQRVVDWEASLWQRREHSLYLTNRGSRIEQQIELLLPGLSVTVLDNGYAQTRNFGGHAYLRQGGLEILEQVDFHAAAERLTDEALQLLAAPDCPSGQLDVVLAPDQMILQIHESIGHPLELDRILGDERNYAGTSFVTLDMFGHYQYGSELLNVTFDPGVIGEAAGYRFDDDGDAAGQEYLIRDGILCHPLGGRLSRLRANYPATNVANSRASGWNRPPIDRMANLNIEPGSATTNELTAGVENGVFMQTNRSWSIDDSRNKFQFGCEWGQKIENGELTHVVKNPNYRGISASFWRNLSGVGDSSECLGTPYCGKGEPNQVVSVGHASPACRFSDIAVFGGG